MSKRFLDTGLYRDKWFKSLPAPYKLLWQYILTECDCAGVWEVEEEIAQVRIGCDAIVDFSQAVEKFNDGKKRIYVFHNEEKWLIIDFVKFQYGLKLYRSNTAHRGVIQRLNVDDKLMEIAGVEVVEKNRKNEDPSKTLERPFEDPLKTLPSPLEALKDKDKDKDKDKPISITSSLSDNSLVVEETPTTTTEKKKPKTQEERIAELEERKQKFRESLEPYVEKYGRKMIDDFFDYWSEYNKSLTKMNWELKPTWQTSGRLATWYKKENDRTLNGNKSKELRRQADVRATCPEDYEGGF